MNERSSEQILQSLSRLSGMKLAWMDDRLRGVAVFGQEAGAYCRFLHTSQQNLEACLASNREAFAHVKKTGELYCYRCPFGLGEMIAPLGRGDRVTGYLIMGPFIREEWEGEILALVRGRRERGLREALASVRRLSREEIDGYCDLLRAAAFAVEALGGSEHGEQTVGQAVKSYIKRNLSRKITLSELSLHVHCSTVTLTKHFREEFGTSVTAYVTEKRMALAEQLLAGTNLPITEIAERCGFCDAEYFARCFKRERGSAPSEYRAASAIRETARGEIDYQTTRKEERI